MSVDWKPNVKIEMAFKVDNELVPKLFFSQLVGSSSNFSSRMAGVFAGLVANLPANGDSPFVFRIFGCNGALYYTRSQDLPSPYLTRTLNNVRRLPEVDPPFACQLLPRHSPVKKLCTPSDCGIRADERSFLLDSHSRPYKKGGGPCFQSSIDKCNLHVSFYI